MIDNKEKRKLEKDFISLLLKHKELVGNWLDSSTLKIQHFDEDHHLILHAIEQSYEKDVLLTRKTYASFLEKTVSKKLERNAQEHLFNEVNISTVKVDDFPNLKEKICEAYIERTTLKSIEEYKNNKNDKGGIYAVRKLTEQLSTLSDDSVQEKPVVYESITDYANDYYLDLLKRKEAGDINVIKCFIDEIDATMGVGFAPGTLTLFTADVGSYKSTIMLNVGINVWEKAGKNVLYVPLEMPRKLMYQKFLSRFLKIPFEKLEHPKYLSDKELEALKNSQELIKQVDEKMGGKLFIMEAPEQIPISVIKREIEKNIEIFKPHVVVIDYIANLVPDSRQRETREDLEIGRMLKGLRTMGKPGSVHKEGFAIVSAAQIGREALKRVRRSGAGKVSFHSEDIRGSHEYSADADVMYAQMPDPQQPANKLWLYCVKSRYGSKVFTNKTSRAILNVKPEINLIENMDVSVYSNSHDDIMNKVNNTQIASANILDFEEEQQEQEETTDFDFDEELGLK